jgi:phenylpropionate dioxygenase-like ring-hydroxylating dioxygenase large terminal subunit
MCPLMDDRSVAQRILDHIDQRSTDLADASWREPVDNYRSPARFAAEMSLVLRRTPTPFCPAAALSENGSYVAREAARTPVLAVRGDDGRIRAFRNTCRHRGTLLVDGTGREKAFVCRYHGWTYGLDGCLRHVPHEYGFPSLDKSSRGLIPLATEERHGIVFVTQDEPHDKTDLAETPQLIPPTYRLVTTNVLDVPANWKILAEGFLEGYHIRSTHRDTFYPRQFDNLNVVETFGRNGRIAFPYRNINKLRVVPPADRAVDGMLTYVYHLFPNAFVATFPTNRVLIVLEPLSVEQTQLVTFTMAAPPQGDEGAAKLETALGFVEAGAVEDREVACAIQRGLAGGGNEFFEFGRFEGLISHFHRNLHELIDAGTSSPFQTTDSLRVLGGSAG